MAVRSGVVIAAAALVLAACTSGTGHTGSTAPLPSPTGSGSTSSPTSPPLPSAAPSMATATRCAGLPYCDDFADAKSGWPHASTAAYLLGYSAFGGGSYRIASRHAGVIYQEAPVDVSRFAPDYAVRVDADVTPSPTTSADLVVGLRCWGHAARDGTDAGFAAYVYPDHVELTVRGDDGKVVGLTSTPLPHALPRPGTRAHLALVCLQTRDNGATLADVALALNGTTVLETTYGHDPGAVPWSVGKHVGLLVGEKGGDVYFDNVGVSRVSG